VLFGARWPELGGVFDLAPADESMATR
jgi:hypothetical protein